MMKTFVLSFLSWILLAGSVSADPLAVGQPAPQLTAVDQDGKTIHFADSYAEGPTLVYFYPKANTGGCTAEACSLRDSYEKLHAQGLQIIGVSRDKTDSQKSFKSKFNLPFTLIADPDGKVADAFGVPTILFLNMDARQSFIVKNGKIAWNSLKAKTEGSAEEVQAALNQLK